MQITKKVLLLLFVIAGFFTANAQGDAPAVGGPKGNTGGPNYERRAEAQAKALSKNLNLDATKAAEVKEIYLKYGKEMEAARAMDKSTPEAKKARRVKQDQIRVDQEAALKAALTAEQWAAWQKKKEENRAAGEAKRQAKGKEKGKDKKEGATDGQ